MLRKLSPTEIVNLSDADLLANLNQLDSFDSETIVLFYGETQDRNMTLSSNMLFALLDYSSKNGWEDLNVEVSKFTTKKGFDSYANFKKELLQPSKESSFINGGDAVPLTPLLQDNGPRPEDSSKVVVLEKQMNEVVQSMSSAGDSLGKVFGSLIGQLSTFVGFMLFIGMLQSNGYGRRSSQNGIAVLTVIYVILTLFFMIRMLVHLSRSSSALRNITSRLRKL